MPTYCTSYDQNRAGNADSDQDAGGGVDAEEFGDGDGKEPADDAADMARMPLVVLM